MCGLPIISWNVGGVKEIIKNELNGKLLNKLNEKEIQKILDIYLSKKNHKNLSLKIRNFAKKQYSTKIITKKYLKLYKKILSKNRTYKKIR